MKKQYISPEAVFEQMALESLLSTASITGVDKGDLEHEIETGGNAGEGISSDSRRISVWDDDLDDDEF